MLMPNIIVLVKQVPDTNAKIVVNGDRVDLSSVKMVMSPYDEFAVETALKHKEAAGGEVGLDRWRSRCRKDSQGRQSHRR